MKQISYVIQGTAPLMTHNERLANPFDDVTVQMKAITGKRKKTQDDLEEIARLEWTGGLYFDDDVGVHVPGYNVFAALVGGAKIHKLGTAVKRGVVVSDDRLPIEFEGPASPEELFKNRRFVDMRSVKVGTSKVLRCRPIFRDWRLKFTLLFEESVISSEDLNRIVEDTGRMVGLGDYRPRFGRFEVMQ